MEVNKQVPFPAVSLEIPARGRGCSRLIHRFPFCFPRMAAIFIITVLVYQTARAAYQPPALLLERITDTVYIPDDHMAFLEDPERKYDLKTIRQEDQFKPGPLPADIRQAETWWIQLRFESRLLQAQTWWLDIQGDYVDAYLISGAGDGVDLLQTGFMQPFNRKAIKLPYSMWTNNIPVHLEAGQSARLFIRVHHPTRRKDIRDPDYLVHPPFARLQLAQKRAEVNGREGAFQAILIMVIVYLMVNYSQTRALSGIYLIGFCTLIGLYFLLVDEYLYQWAFPDIPILRYYLGFGLIYSALIIADVFTRRILHLKALLPQWDTFLLYRSFANSFIMLGLLVTFNFSFNYDFVNTISNYYLIFLFAPSYLIFTLFLLKSKEQIAKFAGWAGMTWVTLGVIGLVGIQFLSMERELAFLILQAGVAGYIIIWVTALGYRAGKDRQEKWEARKIALKNEARWQEEHRIAAELKELDVTKSRFFANVSHELRTPLTLIIGPVKELQKRFAGKKGMEEEQNWLQLIRDNANQLLQLINEILELSRLEAGKMELHQRPVVLYPWLNRILSSFESLARDQAVALTLNCQLPPEKAYLLDPDKLERILTNLLSNAMKHTPSGGTVEVKAGRKGKQLMFQVLDTGPGILPEDLPYIFDRYYQSKGTKDHIEGGTGIGLALSKEIAQFLGGQIDAANRKEGGAVFSLLHPLQSTDFSEQTALATAPDIISALPEVAGAAASLPDSPPDGVEGSTILLVEDHHDMRRYIENILQNRYPVVTCHNGKEALQYLMEHPDRHKAQLILSDVMMPVMDGFTLLEEVKKHPRLRLLPFMLLTARAGINSKLKAFRIGVDDYLIKPFEKAELLARIDSLLHNYHNRLQWTEKFSNMNNTDHKKLFKPSGFSEKEQSQLDNLEKITKEHLDNPRFNVAFLSDQLGVSKRNLNRITRALVGLTPNRYIKKVRMEVARQLLETCQVNTVKEAVRKVGLQDPEHFSREFKKEYGRKPSDYL